MLGATVSTVYVIARRDHWRRLRLGRTVAYALDDVTDTLDARVARTSHDRCKVST
jgi:hypothetical protein